jgi:hypothetical protein
MANLSTCRVPGARECGCQDSGYWRSSIVPLAGPVERLQLLGRNIDLRGGICASGNEAKSAKGEGEKAHRFQVRPEEVHFCEIIQERKGRAKGRRGNPDPSLKAFPLAGFIAFQPFKCLYPFRDCWQQRHIDAVPGATTC